MPIAPLVASGDTNLASWQAGTQSEFLDMACAEVRKFCGWHIAPSVDVVGQRCWFGARNYVMLPSAYVTAVTSVSVDGTALVADTDYFWDVPRGWIRRAPNSAWTRDRFALVDFTHGYDDCPSDVKAVIFEVLATAMELPASNAEQFSTMQYNFKLRPDTGIALSDQQKVRLGRYRVRSFGGLTGP